MASSSSVIPRLRINPNKGAQDPEDDIDTLRHAINHNLTKKLVGLIKKGIDLNVRFVTGDQVYTTPLQYAIKIFAEKTDNPEKRREIINILLDAPHIDINKTNGLGETPLMIATLYQDIDSIKKILRRCSSECIDAQNGHGETALMYAIKRFAEKPDDPEKRREIINILLDAPHIDINKTNGLGETPLMIATLYEDIDSIKQILRRCSDKKCIDAQNDDGETALMYACRSNNSEIKRVIEKAGANTKITDKAGNTAEWYNKENSLAKLQGMVDQVKGRHKGGKKKRTNKKRKHRRSFTRSIMRLFSK
jgi:ankyrin repeat protein